MANKETISIEAAFKLALEHLQAGRCTEADRLCTAIIQAAPGHVDAINLLGIIAQKVNRHDLALEQFSRALALDDTRGLLHYNQGCALHSLGRTPEAVTALKKAQTLEPHNDNIAALLHQITNAGVETTLQQGLAAHRAGRISDAVACYEQVLDYKPSQPVALANIGLGLSDLGRLAEAEEYLHRALALEPNVATTHNSLGINLYRQKKIQPAIASYEKAIELDPGFAKAHNNLGVAREEVGELEAAEASYRRAVEIQPEYGDAYTNLLFSTSYYSLYSPDKTLDVHKRWAALHASPHPDELFVHNRKRNPDKRLKIGYVSPDFRYHPISVFLEKILANHNRDLVEVFCYSNVANPDHVTQRLIPLAAVWRDTAHLDDKKLAELIHADGIDILIDLAGHGRGNRLKSFALKPAPVQAAYLGYCTTTGLHAMDYWLTDPILTPEDTVERSVETIMRLSDCWICYNPVDDGAIGDITRHTRDRVVFGSFNNLSKLTRPVLELWSRILKEVPDSMLLLKTKQLMAPEGRTWITARFAEFGIGEERLILQPSTVPYLAQYGHMDIALDPFPRTGGTMTADALWMGVPVITLAGSRMIQRQGVSILTAVGQTQWIATTPQEYLTKAVALAKQGIRSIEERQKLHAIVAASPLCDAKRFIKNLEAAYRRMWNMDTAATAASADELFTRGVKLHQGGNIQEAIANYEQGLALEPDNCAAWGNLGGALQTVNRPDEAITAYRKALAIDPGFATAHCNLGIIYMAKGDMAAAIRAMEQAIALKPDFPEAHYNLGNFFKNAHRLSEAATSYETAIAQNPGYAKAHNGLGQILMERGNSHQAIAHLQKAVDLAPDNWNCWNTLGNSLNALGRLDEAVTALQKAIAADPRQAKAYNNLGNALAKRGDSEAALAAFKQAITIEPDFAVAYSNMGAIVRDRGRLDEAAACLAKAIELQPGSAMAHNNLATVLQDQGRFEEAIANYERALEIQPEFATAHSNMLFAIAYYALMPPEETLAAHKRWDRMHGVEGKSNAYRHEKAGQAGRILNIGYVSPDFRQHPVTVFFRQILQNHNRDKFKVHCYAEVAAPDAITRQLEKMADVWRSTVGLEQREVARMIHDDAIDILIDLAGHTAGNRLQAFTYRPAPVQATWLGYCATTGLESMDYWISDGDLVPDDSPEATVETVLRLPESWVCYQAAEDAPVRLARRDNPDQVVFGSFNDMAKTSKKVIALWCRILRELPNSRLLLKTIQLGDDNARKRILSYFAEHGIGEERLTLLRFTTPYLHDYGLMDIALDTFPRTGGITSADALWMGVPLVTLAGERMIERQGVSLLSTIGKKEWIAQSREEYMDIALGLAAKGVRSTKERQKLHDRVAASPLCDQKGFIAHLEDLYRRMWRQIS